MYQGRYKSFPVQDLGHFLRVARYIERNARRANLVLHAEDWRWCSLWRRVCGGKWHKQMLSPWPVERPTDWVRRVNKPQTRKELEEIRECVRRGRPYGTEAWVSETASRLGLESTLKPLGGAKKAVPVTASGGGRGLR